MNTHKVTLVALAAMAVALTLAIAPALTTSAFAKIQEADTGSENPAGKAAPGQQPTAKGGGQTQFTENQNPAGSAPPGQNK